MKRLHWDTLPPSKLEPNTLWQKLAGPDLGIDCKSLESDFAQSRSKTKSQKKQAVTQSEKVGKKVTLLEPTRSRNCEIRFNRVGRTPDELKEALLARFRDGLGHHPQTESPRHLSDADLSLLSQALPTEEEVKSIRSFKGHPNQLGPVEKFYHVLATIPHVQRRVELLLFRAEVTDQGCLSHLGYQIKLVIAAAKELKSSSHLELLLQIILAAGNHMNGGTARGAAYGFQLDFLTKLQQTKTTDNKQTLVHWIARTYETMKRGNNMSGDITADLSLLQFAAKVDENNLSNELKELKSNFSKVSGAVLTGHKEDPFTQGLTQFLTDYRPQLEEVENQLIQARERTTDLNKYFMVQSAQNWNQVFSIFDSFMTAFTLARDQIQQPQVESTVRRKDDTLNSVPIDISYLHERVRDLGASTDGEGSEDEKWEPE
jgi:diaphanous 2